MILETVKTVNDIENYFSSLQKTGYDTAILLRELNQKAGVLFDADGGKMPVENYSISAFLQMQKEGKIPVLSHVESPQSTNTAEVGKVHTQAKENATTPDFDILAQYIRYGFTLYAQKEGKNEKGEHFRYTVDFHNQELKTAAVKYGNAEQCKIKTFADLETAISNGVKLFTFRPAERSFLCIDIDQHKNETDGLETFYGFLDKIGARNKSLFKDIASGSFPVFTKSPNGYHLYFNVSTVEKLAPCKNIAPNVETKSGNNDITAAGSIKKGKLYALNGNIAAAPQIPLYLLKYLQKEEPKRNTFNQYQTTPYKKDGYKIEQLAQWAETDRAPDGIDISTKHGLTMAIAIKCRNHGISLEECLSFCSGYDKIKDHTQLESTIRSIYEKQKY